MRWRRSSRSCARPEVHNGGPERARQKHLGAGKQLRRERVERLLDPGMYVEAPSGEITTGIGRISRTARGAQGVPRFKGRTRQMEG